MLIFSTVYSKIRAFVIIAGIIFLIFSFALDFHKTRLENQITRTSEIHFKHEITSLIDLNSESMMKTLIDNVYWDDLVLNVEKNDTAWFTPNMSLVAAEFFDFYLVSNSRFITVRQESGKTIHSEIIIPIGLLESLKQSRTTHFFMLTPDGLMEGCAGSIHPSDDLNLKKSQPFGYLVLMKKWDQKYINHLSTILGSKIEIKTSHDSIFKGNSSAIQAKIQLTNWDGSPVAELISSRDLNLNFHVTQYIFYIIMAFVLLILFLFSLMSRIWIYQPLKLVTDVLKTDNYKSIDQLKKTPAEYGHIGDLFEAYVTQKQELIEAKGKAEESDRLKSAFLANISHEIRTPMNGILGFAEILKAPDLTGEQQQEYIITMEKCGARMLNIIDDIVDLSKIESGQMNVSVSETNVNEKIIDIYNFFKPEAEQKGLQIYYKNALPDNEAIIKTDRSKLFSILTNLVKNAIKFTSQGSVEFGYSSTLRPAQSGAGSLTDGSPTELTFFVNDTGIGILPEHKEIIFERFRQVGESLSRDYQGAGLGLAISKAYVEMLGGQIWVEGLEGKGTTFFFTIPYLIFPNT